MRIPGHNPDFGVRAFWSAHSPRLARLLIASFLASFIVSIPSQVIYAPISNATTTTVPSNTTLPTESVTATSGTVMGVPTGTWNDGGDLAPTTSYHWQISSDLLTWTSVSGATSASYTPVPEQVGSYLRAQVTRTNSLGSTSVI